MIKESYYYISLTRMSPPLIPYHDICTDHANPFSFQEHQSPDSLSFFDDRLSKTGTI